MSSGPFRQRAKRSEAGIEDADSLEHEVRVKLGGRLRAHRQNQKMTGRALATAAGVTPGFISQVENGQASPSLATLLKLCVALDVRIGDIFTDASSPSSLVRAADRPVYQVPDARFEEAIISSDRDAHVEVLWSRLFPGGGSGVEPLRHGSETECVFVLRGEVVVTVDDERFVLREGDCLTLPGHSPHGCRNESSEPVELLWINAPATY